MDIDWSSQWKRQLENLNRLCLWMMCCDEITDDGALTAIRELKAWLRSIERLLDSTEGNQQ